MQRFFTFLKRHAVLAVLLLILSLGQQYFFYVLKGFPVSLLSAGKTFGFLAFFFLVTLIRERSFRITFSLFILVLNFFQMTHLSFYGTQVLPSEIWLLFSEFHEINGTLLSEPIHFLLPLFLTLVPAGIIVWLDHKRVPVKTFPALGYLLVLYFIYNPVRTFITGNSWGRQPSVEHLGGFNLYLSLSYFTGKILPHKLNSERQVSDNSSSLLEITGKSDTQWDKIIVILGESHTPHLMSLFGYEKETTPYLNSLKGNDSRFYSTLGLSAGVSTDISVAFFMNMGFGLAGTKKAAQGKHCLLKLARDTGYTTHFWSTQSRQQLRYIAPYICHSSLDSFRSLEDVDPEFEDENAASDLKLIPGLTPAFDKGGKQFVVLHQRGSHSPWNLRYSPESAKFAAVPGDDRSHHYENSLYEFDRFWKELDQMLLSRKEKVLVVYVSDHGEAVGKKGRWGHGFLDHEAFEIPVIVRSYNQDLPAALNKRPALLTQYNVGLLVASQLGLTFNQETDSLPSDFEIYGNDIDGFAGKAAVTFGPEGKYQFTVK